MKQMTPKEKGQFLIDNFKNDNGDLTLNDVDLSDFKGNVALSNWKVGGSLFLDHQEVKGDLYQCNQRVGRILYQDEQEAGGVIIQDGQKAEDGCKSVEPDYKAEYDRLQKELREANRKNEALLWALANAMEASK